MSCPVAPSSASDTDAYATHRGSSGGSGCPIDHANINPRNNMPVDLSSMPESSDQRIHLSTHRTISSIPKPDIQDDTYGSGKYWEYPSPQQFHNALRRKGMATNEEDVDTMVLIHNFLNERCWREVVEWEQRRQPACCTQGPLLVRFQGKPKEPTPKSRIMTFLGLAPKPFDRHDWVVQRCDGTERRYVIDYYGGEEEVPGDDVPVFYADVRPALDSVDAAVDRLSTAIARLWSTWTNKEQAS